MRSTELVPGGYLIIAVPASTAPWPDGVSVYHALIHEMNQLLAEWRAAGVVSGATVAATVVPVWNRTLEEIRARPPLYAGKQACGLILPGWKPMTQVCGSVFRASGIMWAHTSTLFAGVKCLILKPLSPVTSKTLLTDLSFEKTERMQ